MANGSGALGVFLLLLASGAFSLLVLLGGVGALVGGIANSQIAVAAGGGVATGAGGIGLLVIYGLMRFIFSDGWNN